MSQHNKKVLFTSHTANFSKFNRPFMRWFKELGYEVHYASAGEEDVLDTDKHFTIPFERSPFKLNNLRAIQQLKKIIDTEHYDIIHTHTPMGSVITRLAAIKARKHGTRVIYTAHGFHFYKGAPVMNWIIYYPIEKIMAYFTDTLVTINQEDFHRASTKFKTNVQYIRGVGVDLSRFNAVSPVIKQKLRKAYGYQKDDFILIYAAELNDNKNQIFIINQVSKICHLIPEIKLILCGIGPLHNKFQKAIKKLKLENFVKMLGYRDDINILFQLSDICVASSIREGFGLNLVEAMATGLPILASDNRGHRDIIHHGLEGYLYTTNNQIESLKYLKQLYGNLKKRQEIAICNPSYAAFFSMQKAINDMSIIYTEILRNKNV